MRITVFVFTLVCLAMSQTLLAQTHPACVSALSDFDGDGWGWEFNRSCIVDDTSNGSAVCEDPDGDGFGWDGFNTCTPSASNSSGSGASGTASICVDSDGDGFGWDGLATCTMATETLVTTQGGSAACIDSDGDGFGWDGFATCTVPGSGASGSGSSSSGSSNSGSTGSVISTGATAGECIDTDGDGFGWNGVSTCGLFSGVTDVVLMMGQSNALGEDTGVERNGQDATTDNIIAWTQFDGWQVADLCTQIWQKGWFPWRGGVCSNHPAFQIAKGIVAADPSRKVAIIPTGVAGKPISWWDDGAFAYALAAEQALEALAALPGHSQIDLVAWSQGEADHGSEDVWFTKLNDLISRLRSESWIDAQSTVFVAQETKDSSVNEKLPLFDSDNDRLTNWITASDLSTKDGVHWGASALRSLGNRYAAKYLSIVN